MAIAVVGGTGFIGTPLVERLVARGAEVIAISRGKRPVAVPAGATFVQADRMDTAALTAAFRDHGVDTVIDIFAITVANTQPLLDAVGSVGGRYVLISSADVYRNYEGLLGKSEPPVQAEPAREDDPLRTLRYPFRGSSAGGGGMDDYDKIVIEDAARADTRFATTIMRLPMIFGPGDRQHRFRWIVDVVAKSRGLIELDERAAAWRTSFGYITDVAEAIAVAALSPEASGRTYNAAQADARSQLEWLLTFGVVMGKRIEVETVPADRRGLLADMADTSDIRYPLTLDTTRIRTELGYTEIILELDALRATVEWERTPD